MFRNSFTEVRFRNSLTEVRHRNSITEVRFSNTVRLGNTCSFPGLRLGLSSGSGIVFTEVYV